MTDAVTVVRNHGSRLPQDIQIDLQLRLFKLCKDIDAFTQTWSPSVREEISRQLLTEQEEQRRNKRDAMEQLRKQEELDMIMEASQDTNAPPDNAGDRPVPTREELYNMMLQLQKQIRMLDDKIYFLENNNKDVDT